MRHQFDTSLFFIQLSLSLSLCLQALSIAFCFPTPFRLRLPLFDYLYRGVVERGYKVGIVRADSVCFRINVLNSKTVIFTCKHSREEYKALIDKNGGKNSGSISKKTSLILAGENMGPSKLEKAKSLGVPIINED